MANKQPTYEDLVKLAQKYCVDDNEVFMSACVRYSQTAEMIEQMRAEVERTGVMVPRVNVRGDTNLDANPLLTQLAKFTDTANKTLALMLDIINRLGHEADEQLGGFDCE